MTVRHRVFVLGILAVFGFGITMPMSSIFAHSGATGIVKERMDLMKRYDELVDRLFAIVHGELPYGEKFVAKAAREIKETSGDHIVKLFPKGSVDKPSEADPAIWRDMDTFVHMADRLRDFAAIIERDAGNKPSETNSLPAKWEDVPAMGGMMGQGRMMGRGGSMMGRGMMGGNGNLPGNAGTMESNLWRLAHMCNTCHQQFRIQKK